MVCSRICKCEYQCNNTQGRGQPLVKQGNASSEIGKLVGWVEMTKVSESKGQGKLKSESWILHPGWGFCGDFWHFLVVFEWEMSWHQLFLWSYLNLKYEDTQLVCFSPLKILNWTFKNLSWRKAVLVQVLKTGLDQFSLPIYPF